MDNCSNHPKEIPGFNNMNELAIKISELNYETLAELLECLADKIYDDGYKDHTGNLKKLGIELYCASRKIKEAHSFIQSAYYISKPFMEPKKL